MTAFDYRRNALHRAGPGNETAVHLVAQALHLNDTPQHAALPGPCPECWRHAGDAIEALRDARIELAQPVEVTT